MDKMTVHEVSQLTGVSIRTLQYYDKTGLLTPAEYTDSGYRLYDSSSLERLQQILIFKELEFPLKSIKVILDNPDFDREKALGEQIELLKLKRQQLEKLIELAQDMQRNKPDVSEGGFRAFDKTKLKEYAERAEKEWGDTSLYAEFKEKSTSQDYSAVIDGLMEIFREFGTMRTFSKDSAVVRTQITKLRSYITDHFYTCTDEILLTLADVYTSNDEFRKNIDDAGGEVTAEFVSSAVKEYLGK